MIHPQFLLSAVHTSGAEVVEVPVPVGLLFTGLIIRTLLGVVVVAAVVIFLWKASKLADAYTEKLRAK